MANSSQKIILVVDDDKDFRITLVNALESYGYRVYSAENGDEGIRILDEIPRPNLILVDYLMPLMNGYNFLKAINLKPKLADIPLLVVSGARGVPELPTGTNFLRKPFTIETLVATIAKLITN